MRNYQINPLKYAEKPSKEDIEYLYIEQNKTKKELMRYFDKSKDTVSSWFKYYNIKKPKALIKQSIERVQIERYGTAYYMQSKFYQDKKEQINAKRVETNLKIYGTKTPVENEEIKKKIKETCLKDIDINGLNVYQRARKKGIQTCLKKYGVSTYSQTQECKNKVKDFFNKKYGVDSYTQAQEFKQKYNEVCLQKYGKPNYVQTKEYQIKSKQTKKEKYGNENYNNRDLAKQTCLKKFGKITYTQTQEYKDKYCDKDSILLRQNKANKTKRQNKTFNTSEQENKVAELLIKKYPNTIRQYRSEEYPFDCDFYIPEQNLYIETSFFWTHGKYNHKVYGPFDKTNTEHLLLLEFWKNKNTKFYKQAIYTWTNLDVRKLECFKKNNLNYKIFYTMEEFNQWYKTIQ